MALLQKVIAEGWALRGVSAEAKIIVKLCLEAPLGKFEATMATFTTPLKEKQKLEITGNTLEISHYLIRHGHPSQPLRLH